MKATQLYSLELLFSEEPQINLDDILNELEFAGLALEHQAQGDLDQLQFECIDTALEPSDQNIGHMQLMKARPIQGKDKAIYHEFLTESVRGEALATAINTTKWTLSVNDFMSNHLEAIPRLNMLAQTMKALVNHSNATVIVNHVTEEIIEPEIFKNEDDQLAGFLNIRLFNDDEGNILMDTLGLAQIGLYDIQCYFHSLAENEIATLLKRYAYYFFNENPKLNTSQIVEGLNGEDWELAMEDALAPPTRRVFQLHPLEANKVNE